MCVRVFSEPRVSTPLSRGDTLIPLIPPYRPPLYLAGYMWEVCECARRILLCSVVVFMGESASAKCTWGVFLACIFAISISELRPCTGTGTQAFAWACSWHVVMLFFVAWISEFITKSHVVGMTLNCLFHCATGAADEEAKLFTGINVSHSPYIGVVLLLSEMAIIIGAFSHMKAAKRLQEQQQTVNPTSPLTNVDTNTELDNLCARLESSLDGLKAQKMFGGYFVAFRGVAQIESTLNDLRRTSYEVLMSVDVVKSLTASRVDSETKAALEQALDLVQEQPVEKDSVRFDDAPKRKSSLFLPSRELEARSVSFEDICDWESWDLFEFAASADPGALFPLLFEAVADQGLDAVSELQLSRTRLGKLLQDAQRTYESAGRKQTTPESSSLDLLNAYHHSLHGADVLCTNAVMLTKLPDAVTGTQGLSALIKFSCCMASIMHDYGHGGLPNRFLNQLMVKASVMYSDDSTLERLHLALAFELIYESHLLDPLSQQQRQLFRKTVVSLVLATVSSTTLRTRSCSRSRLPRT